MLKKVMSKLHDKLGLSNPKTNNEVTLKFTKSELEALFIALGETSFKGKQVELIYNLAVKLQMGLNNLNKE